MNCKDYLKENLKGAETPQGLKHLSNCKNCQELLLDIEEQIEQIGKTDRIKDSNPFFYTRVKQRIENRQKKNIVLLNNRFVTQLGNFTTLIIVGMFLGLLFFKQFGLTEISQFRKENKREQMIENIMKDHFLISEPKSISIFESV